MAVMHLGSVTRFEKAAGNQAQMHSASFFKFYFNLSDGRQTGQAQLVSILLFDDLMLLSGKITNTLTAEKLCQTKHLIN